MTRLVPDRKCSDQYTSFLNDVWTTVLMRVHGKWLIRWKSRESSLRNKKKDKIVTYGSGKRVRANEKRRDKQIHSSSCTII